MNKSYRLQTWFLFLALLYVRNLVESKNENDNINVHLENYAKKNINRSVKYVELCIKTRKETREFHYHEDDETKTGVYIAKKGHLFNLVKLNRPWYMCIFNNCKIWAASDDRTLSNMVLVNGINKTEIIVYVYLNNGDKKFYYRLGFYDSFRKLKPVELRSFLDESKYPTNVKLVFSDIFNYNIDNNSKYKVYCNTLYNVFKIEHPNFSSYDYILKNNVRCVKIIINDLLVWKQTSKHFPLFIFYYQNLMLVIVKFKVYHYNIYKQFGDKWELVYSTFKESGSRKKQDKQILPMELNRNRENEETESKAASLKKNLESEEIKNNLVKSGGNTNSELITRMQNKLERTRTEIDIDINSRKSNQFYRFSYDPFQGVDSYECKDNYKIKLVKKGIHDLWENEEDIDAVCVDIYYNRKIESSSDDIDEVKDNISNPEKVVVIVYFEGGLRSLTVKNDPRNPNDKINNIEEVRTNEHNGEEIGGKKDNNKHEVFDRNEPIPTSDEELGDDNIEKYNFYGESKNVKNT